MARIASIHPMRIPHHGKSSHKAHTKAEADTIANSNGIRKNRNLFVRLLMSFAVFLFLSFIERPFIARVELLDL
jgi:hypothetical protein